MDITASYKNPILQTTSYQSPYAQDPNITRLTLEQQYNNLSQQLIQNQQHPQSDPYSDYIAVLNSCTDVTREKIVQDKTYINIYLQCENLLKQSMYARIIPEVINTPHGRQAFEQLHSTTKVLKDEYVQQDLQREKEMELQAKRLAEKEAELDALIAKATQSAQAQQPVQSTPLPQPVQYQYPQQPQYDIGGNG